MPRRKQYRQKPRNRRRQKKTKIRAPPVTRPPTSVTPTASERLTLLRIVSNKQDENFHLSDAAKTAKLNALIQQEFLKATNNGEDFKTEAGWINEQVRKHILEPQESALYDSISEVHAKYGKGAFVVVFEYPHHVAELKVSQVPTISSKLFCQDSMLLFPNGLVWFPIKQIETFFDKKTADIAAKYDPECNAPVFTGIFNNFAHGIFTEYHFHLVDVSPQSKLMNGIFADDKISYSALQAQVPHLLRTLQNEEIQFDPKLSKKDDIKKFMTDLRLTALRHEHNSIKGPRGAQTAINFLFPKKMYDLLPQSFDPEKKLFFESKLDDIHSDQSYMEVLINEVIKTGMKNNDDAIKIFLNACSLPICNMAIQMLEDCCKGSEVDYYQLHKTALFAEQPVFKKRLDNALYDDAATEKIARKLEGNHCDCCGISERDHRSRGNKNFKKCRRCRRRWYCSEKCQKKDWPSHGKNCKSVEFSTASNDN